MTTVDKTLRKLMTAPPVKWAGIMGKLSSSDRLTLSRALSHDAQRLAFLSEYAETFYDGPDGHDYAVNKARRLTARVRRALGYTYPKEGFATLRF